MHHTVKISAERVVVSGNSYMRDYVTFSSLVMISALLAISSFEKFRCLWPHLHDD